MNEKNAAGNSVPVKCLIIVYSYHHGNTLRIAEEFAGTLAATVITPDQVVLADLEQYDIIGFGAGIDSGCRISEEARKGKQRVAEGG